MGPLRGGFGGSGRRQCLGREGSSGGAGGGEAAAAVTASVTAVGSTNRFGWKEVTGDGTDSSLDCFSGNVALCSSAPGVATAQGLGTMAQVQGGSSLREACRRLALCRALLLWRTRLSQHRKAE